MARYGSLNLKLIVPINPNTIIQDKRNISLFSLLSTALKIPKIPRKNRIGPKDNINPFAVTGSHGILCIKSKGMRVKRNVNKAIKIKIEYFFTSFLK